MPHKMRAATYSTVGNAADVLDVSDVDRPAVAPGEVRVRVIVAGINPTDVKIRSGATPRQIDGFQVPLMDGAGVIDQIGAGVDPSRLGERVWVMLAAAHSRWGTAAEFCVVPAHRALSLPADVSFDVGATLGVPALTAAHCLLNDGPITGRDVLVAGGAGAVGRAAVELARWSGARVAATVSGTTKAEIATAAGAELVVNYREPDAALSIKQWSSGIDRVIEVALGTNLDLDLSVVRNGATVVTYAIDGDDPVLPIRRCMAAGVRLEFMLLYSVPERALQQAVANVSDALAEGALTLGPVTRFGLEDIVAAQQAMEAGPVGRVLVDIP